MEPRQKDQAREYAALSVAELRVFMMRGLWGGAPSPQTIGCLTQ